MSEEIRVPEIGESISSGILAAWLKKDGEVIAQGDEVFELETDKATLAVPSPYGGKLTTAASEGDEVEVGQVVGRVDTDRSNPTGPVGDAAAKNDAGSGAANPSPESSAAAPALSPAVRRIVEENGLDAASIAGTGPGGRITKKDAQSAADAKAASPDVPRATATRSASPAPPSASSMSTNDRQSRVPMSSLRRRIAENLVYSRQSSAHVTTFNEIDMSRVMEIRTQYKESFQAKHGVKLGFMGFFVTASRMALQEYPGVNAYIDGTDVVYNDYVNIGVALSSEKGLLTPVLRDVSQMGFADIEGTIADYIKRAGEKRLKPDEMTGATFTISNGGVFGSLLSTPIPSPPQTAVLGMHAIQKRPVVVNDEIVIRSMMYVALTYDHRMIDGREGVGFLGRIKQLVEEPTQLLLGI